MQFSKKSREQIYKVLSTEIPLPIQSVTYIRVAVLRVHNLQ